MDASLVPAILLLEHVEVHLVVVQVAVGVEHLGDGLVDAGEDLVLVLGDALDPLLGHEEGDPVAGVVAGEGDGAVDHVEGHVKAGPVLLPETLLGHLQEALQAATGRGDVVPGQDSGQWTVDSGPDWISSKPLVQDWLGGCM